MHRKPAAAADDARPPRTDRAGDEVPGLRCRAQGRGRRRGRRATGRHARADHAQRSQGDRRRLLRRVDDGTHRALPRPSRAAGGMPLRRPHQRPPTRRDDDRARQQLGLLRVLVPRRLAEPPRRPPRTRPGEPPGRRPQPGPERDRRDGVGRVRRRRTRGPAALPDRTLRHPGPPPLQRAGTGRQPRLGHRRPPPLRRPGCRDRRPDRLPAPVPRRPYPLGRGLDPRASDLRRLPHPSEMPEHPSPRRRDHRGGAQPGRILLGRWSDRRPLRRRTARLALPDDQCGPHG